MLRRRRFLGLGLGAAVTGACGRGPASPSATTPTPASTSSGDVERIVRGRVLTLDAERPQAEAVAIAAGRIVAVGDEASVLAMRGADTEVIDVGAGLVTPGLVDAHAHLVGLGRSLEEVDLRGATSIDEVVARIREHAPAASSDGGDWILGRGWDQNLWPGSAMPSHHPLTQAFADRPVWLRRIDGHAGWANAAALKASGIGTRTADPEGGEILRDDNGQATGVLVDAAMGLVHPPAPSREALRRQLLAAQRHVLARGLTGVHDMGVGETVDSIYRALATASEIDDPDQRLVLRVLAYADAGWLPSLAGARPAERPEPDHPYALVGIKLYADGALGSRGAALLQPYHDRPDHRGLMQQDPAVLQQQCALAVTHGYQVATHAIGDAANRAVLDAYAAVLEAAKATDARLRIEHAQIVDPADIPRFASLGVIASMQPTHATSDMPWVPARLGPDRLAGAYAWRSFLDAGATLCFGSDFPVELPDVTHGLYAAITRQDAEGRPEGGWRPEQRLELEEAIAAFSRAAAFAGFGEAFVGRLRVGMQADLTCFAQDLRELEPRAVRNAPIAATVVGGRVLHRA